MRRRWALAGLAAAGVAALVEGSRRLRARWRRNLDPLDGRQPTFPSAGAHTRIVTTDDGAALHTVSVPGARPHTEQSTGSQSAGCQSAGSQSAGCQSAGSQSAGSQAAAASTAPRTVLIVHGLTSRMDDMGPIARGLVEAGINVVGVDLRGHGQSTIGDDGFGADRLGRDLAAVIDALPVGRIGVVGHSMGAMAAMALALDAPPEVAERIDQLVLIATSADLTDARPAVALRAGSVPLPDVFEGRTTAHLLGAAGAFGPDPSDTMLDAALSSFFACPPATRAAATGGLVGFDIADRLPSVRQPTLVISASHDRVTPPGDGEAIAAAIPHAHHVLMERAGHMVIWERWREIVEAILQNGQR